MDSRTDSEILGFWQEQRVERLVSSEDIPAKAASLDARTKRWRIGSGLLFVALIAIEAWQVWNDREVIEQVGDLLTIAALLYVAFRFRRHRLAAPPVALGRTNSVEFYRAELMRQRDLSKDSWSYLLPFVPGVSLALLGGGFETRALAETAALIGFGVALFLAVAWWNAHTARRLQREIEALDV